MTDYQPRIPVADEYLAALGRAAYNFTYLEWSIVWLTETLDPGFIKSVSSLTAGQIAGKFKTCAEQISSDDPDDSQLKTLATSFKNDLVPRRNALLHGKPFTAEGGEQKLLYHGKHGYQDWTIPDITDIAQSFEVASIKAGNLLHNGRLQAYYTLIKN